ASARAAQRRDALRDEGRALPDGGARRPWGLDRARAGASGERLAGRARPRGARRIGGGMSADGGKGHERLSKEDLLAELQALLAEREALRAGASKAAEHERL